MARVPPRNVVHASKVQWNGDALRSQLQAYDRRPFLDLVAEWLMCSPDPEEVLKFANKYPDRYAGALRQLAQIAGFSDKKEVDIGINLNIHMLSDSQLEDKLKILINQLDHPAEPAVIDLKLDSKTPAD
jgi:hypothetical protein